MERDNSFSEHIRNILKEKEEVKCNSSEYAGIDNVIVEEFNFKEKNYINVLEKIKQSINKKSLACLIVPTSWLFSLKMQDFRDYILDKFHLQGVVVSKGHVLKHTYASVALLLIDFKESCTWFTTATNICEIDVALKNIGEYNRNVYYQSNVDSKNLMPEHYNSLQEQINMELDKYETRRLEEIADVFVGKHVAKEELSVDSGVPYLRYKNITTNGVINKDVFVKEECVRKYAKYILQQGDMVITRSYGEVRYTQIKEEDLPGIASDGLIIIRPFGIPEEYFYTYLTSKTGKALFEKQLSLIQTPGVISNINIANLKTVKVPIFDQETMLEISKSDKLDYRQAIELTEKLGKHVSEIEIEKSVIDQLGRAGWSTYDIQYNTEKCIFHIGERLWRSDISLLYKEKIIAVVEIKSFIKKSDMEFVEKIQQIIKDRVVPILIMTNGMIYDVYITNLNNHKRFYSAPSKDDLYSLLQKGGEY
ncbi:restriction endonuclease subunit S [Clostridium butyricum]|uniref:restriction endonuclease subunit S n=1 Tax=Clostridium butyricum TaxID=1492 RepID=UPI003D34E92D